MNGVLLLRSLRGDPRRRPYSRTCILPRQDAPDMQGAAGVGARMASGERLRARHGHAVHDRAGGEGRNVDAASGREPNDSRPLAAPFEPPRAPGPWGQSAAMQRTRPRPAGEMRSTRREADSVPRERNAHDLREQAARHDLPKPWCSTMYYI